MNTSQPTHWLNFGFQKRIAQSKRSYRLLLIVVLLFIFAWQSIYYQYPNQITGQYGQKYASGLVYPLAKEFVYFYYYLDLVPLLTLHRPLEYSTEGAQQIVDQHGDTLMMEYYHWSRYGNFGKLWTFLPDAYLDGGPHTPQVKTFNSILFMAGLMALWVALWWQRRMLLGLFLVILIGSSPFYLVEVYQRANLFGIPISNALLMLALHIPLFSGDFRRRYYLIPLFAAGLLATIMQIRPEVLPIVSTCLLTYWVNRKFQPSQRVFLTLIFVIVYLSFAKAYAVHFDQKYEETAKLVEAKGGHVYPGPRTKAHPFWHPVFCGLGDFDDKYGYEWHDVVAYRYALPILQEKYGMNLAYSGKYRLDEYYDDANLYYKKLEEIPEYGQIIKQKVLSDIKNDPLWYLEILAKRVGYVFTHTSPVHLNFAGFVVPIPFSGLVFIPVVGFLVYRKQWFELKLMIFTLPLASTAIIIFAKKNTTFHSCFHYITVALLLAWLCEWGIAQYQSRQAETIKVDHEESV